MANNPEYKKFVKFHFLKSLQVFLQKQVETKQMKQS